MRTDEKVWTAAEAETSTQGALALNAQSLTKSYPGVMALQDVSISLAPGEVLGVVGENGAGKSTLMNVISGATAPDAGTVQIGGDDLTVFRTERARELGLAIVRQEPALLPDLSVAENFALGMPAGARPSARGLRAWAEDLLAAWSTSLPFSVTDRVEELLPEHRFIVEICRALAAKPRLLLLDEPTEHLALEDVDRLFRVIDDITARGGAVVYISHRIAEVKRVSNRIAVLRNGRSQGIHDAASLSERDIVNLVVGRVLDATFPPKQGSQSADVVLDVVEASGSRFTDVTVDVHAGEILGLAGIEGNGQREFIRALAGIGALEGALSLKRKAVSPRSTAEAAAAGIGYIAADRHREGIAAGLSVRANMIARPLASVSRFGFVLPGLERSTVSDMLRRFRVRTPDPETDISTLSGGNQQKALLAGLFEVSPTLLLLDEPTQGVDVGARSEIYTLIRNQTTANGSAAVVLSSDAVELAGLCDRVVIFSRGRIVTELSGGNVTEKQITQAALEATTVRERDTRRRHGWLRWLAGDWAPPVIVAGVLAVLVAAGQLVNGALLSPFGLSTVLSLATILVFAALAQAIVMMIGGIDLSVGPLMGFIVVVGSYFFVDGVSATGQLLGWLLMLVVPVIVGLVNWLLSEKVGIHPMIATLVTYIGLQSVSLMLRPIPGGYISSNIINAFSLALGPVPLVFIGAAAVSIVLAWLTMKSRAGMKFRAVGSSGEVARLNGLSPARIRLTAYVAGSLVAGIGGIVLMSQIGSGDPNAGVTYSLASISAAAVGGASLLGGRASFVGGLLAAVLIQVTMAVTGFVGLESAWQPFLLGVVTLLAVAGYSSSRQKGAFRS